MPEYARVCQSMQEYARVCKSMPEYATCCFTILCFKVKEYIYVVLNLVSPRMLCEVTAASFGGTSLQEQVVRAARSRSIVSCRAAGPRGDFPFEKTTAKEAKNIKMDRG